MHAILQTQILGSGMQMEIRQTFFFYLNRDEPWLLVSSRDTAKLFCMLDIPKDTPLLLLIYSDLSGFISGYYAKFFFFKMYCLGKNLFNGHE